MLGAAGKGLKRPKKSLVKARRLRDPAGKRRADDDASTSAAPGSIEIGAAVLVSFAIERGKRTSGFG